MSEALLGLQPREKAAMLMVNIIELFLKEFTYEMEFSSHRREMLLFLIANMAAVTSRANQQYGKKSRK